MISVFPTSKYVTCNLTSHILICLNDEHVWCGLLFPEPKSRKLFDTFRDNIHASNFMIFFMNIAFQFFTSISYLKIWMFFVMPFGHEKFVRFNFIAYELVSLFMFHCSVFGFHVNRLFLTAVFPFYENNWLNVTSPWKNHFYWISPFLFLLGWWFSITIFCAIQ